MKLWPRHRAGAARRRKRVSPLALAAVAAFCGLPLHAAPQLWQGTGADGNWGTTGNFAPGAPFAITDDLQFDGSNFLSDNFNNLSLQSVASLTFNAAADSFTLNGNALFIGSGGITNLSSNFQTISLAQIGPNVTQTWDAGAAGLAINSRVTFDLSSGPVALTITGSGDTTISGPIVENGGPIGGGSLIKTGTGILTLAYVVPVGPPPLSFLPVFQWTGGTTVNQGLINFANNYSFGGGNITLDGGGLQWASGTGTDISERLNAFGAGGATFDTNGSDVTLASALTGPGALTKTGAGTLTLAATNSYLGVTTVTGGLINFSTLGNFGPANITLDGGGLQWAAGNTTDISSRLNAFGLGGATFDSNGNDVTLASALTGSGSLTKSGAGTLALTNAGNTYSGGTTIGAGRVSVTVDDNLGKGGLSFFGGELLVDGSTFSTSKSVEVFDGAAGRLSNSDSANAAFFSGNVFLGAGSTLAIGSAGNAGTIVLMPGGGSATAASMINVDFGTLQNGSGAGFNSISGPATVNVAAGATFDLGGYDTSIGTLLGAGVVTNNVETSAVVTITRGDFSGMIQDGDQPLGLTKVGGSDDILTLRGVNNYSDGTTINGGLINFLVGDNLGTANITLDGGGLQWRVVIPASPTLPEMIPFDISSRLNPIGGGGAIFDTNGNSVNFASALTSQGGGITKTGAGTLSLAAANLYSGPTTVDAGTLLVNGSLAGSSAVAVNSDATLGGIGTVFGSVTVADGGILAPGTFAVGTITLGSLTLNAASQLHYELTTPGGSLNDLTVVTGPLTLDGLLSVVNVGGTNGFGIGTYRLINYTNPEAPLTNNTLGFGIMPSGFSYAIDTATSGQVNLLVEQVLQQHWDGSNFAANNVVDGGSGTWDNSLTNWTKQDGSFNGTWSSLNAVFSGTAGTVTLGDNISFNSLRFQTDGYVINADGSDLFTLSPTGTDYVLVESGVTATINARITGDGGLVKLNPGTLILTGANSYTGGTTLIEGTLGFSENSLGTIGTVTFAVQFFTPTLRWNTGNTQDISSRVLIGDLVTATFDTNGNDVTFASTLQLGTEQSASLTKIGEGTLTLTAPNGYTGTTTVNAGVLAVDNDGITTFGTHGSGPVIVNGDSVTIENPGGPVHYQSGGHVYFLNSATAGNGPFTINAGTVSPTGNGTVEFFDTSSAGTSTITANRGTVLGGAGARVLFHDNSTAGTASVSAFGPSMLNGSIGTGSISIIPGVFGAEIAFFDNSTAGGATLLASGGGSLFFYDDSTGGTARVNLFLGTMSIDQHAAPGVTIGSLEGYGTVNLGSNNLTVGSNDLSTTFAGVIQDLPANREGSGGGSLTKIGEGTLLLSGANTYTGPTQVNAGTLLVGWDGQSTGSLDAASVVTVNNGGTLGGNGTVNGPVMVANGGTLAPGIAPPIPLGSVVVAGNNSSTITLGTLTLNTTSVLAFEMGTPQPPGIAGFHSDLINVNGALTLDGLLHVTDVGGFGAGTYRLINYQGALTNNVLDLAVIPSGFSYAVDTATTGQVNLVVGVTGLQFWDGPNTAANGVVDGGTAFWNNLTTNWTNSTGSLNGAWNSQTAVFGGTAGTVTLGDDIAFAGLQFITNGYVIDPGAIIILSESGSGSGFGGALHALIPTGAAPILVDAGVTATINAQITGAGGLVKINPGTLILTGANTYTGGTGLNAGTVGFSNDSLGTTGTVDFAGSSTLRWNTGNTQDISSRLKIEDGVTATIDTNGNNVTFATTLQLGPAQTAALTKAGAGTLTLTAPNTYTGATTVARGTLAVDNDGITTHGTLGSGATTVNGGFSFGNTGGQLDFLHLASAGNGTFTMEGGFFNPGFGIAVGGRTSFYDNATAGSGNFTMNGSSAMFGTGGATVFNDNATAANGTFTLKGGTAQFARGGFVGFNDSATAGNGTFTTSGATVSSAGGGLVSFNGTSTAGSGTFTINGGTVSGAPGGEMVFNDHSTAGNATLIANGGTSGGEGGSISFLGESTGGTARVALFGNGNLDLSGFNFPSVSIGSLEGSGNVFLDTTNLSVGSNNLDTTFSGVIQNDGGRYITARTLVTGIFDLDGNPIIIPSDPIPTDPGGLTKVGTGTLILSGANTYTGPTTVTAGTLRVNGSLAAASAVTVNNGGTLGGIGTVNGPVTVANGGHLAPGASPGTLTLGTLTLNAGSLLDYELATPNIVGGGVNDLTIVNGPLTLDGTLNIATLPGFGMGTYRLFDYTGLLTNNTLDIGPAPGGFLFAVDVATQNQVNLIVTGGGPLPIAYWNGTHTSPNGIVNGGTFTWDNRTTNWTNQTGTVSGTWANGLGIFAGTAGTVTLADNIFFTGLQFFTDGYVIDAIRGLSLAPMGVAPITTEAGVSATIDAPITGTGGIAKEGAGTLVLNAQNTYSGSTFINGGTLLMNGSLASPQVFVNPGGMLGGNGLFFGQIFNSGLISPGNSPGTLRLNGNYTQSPAGTLRIEIGGRQPGQFDVLEVGGHASLDGTLELVRTNGFKLKRGDRFEILTAEGGVSGEFAHVSNPFAGRTILRPGLVYEDDAVILTLLRESFLKLDGLTPNQRAVAAALDRASDHGRAEKIFAFLDERLLEKLPGDFDKIAPEELTSIFNFVTALANLQGKNLERRTGDLRSGASGFSSGLTMQGNAPSYASTMEFRAGAAGPTGSESKEAKEVLTPAPDNRWGVFLTGVGEWVDVDGDGNARGYDITTGGFTLGLDYKVCSNFAVGIAAGYAGTGIDLTDDGSVLVNGGKLAVYATTFIGGWYADAAVTGGYNSYDTKRSALQGTARGSTDGGELNVLLGTGYDWKLGGLQIGPTANFNYTLTGIDGYTEHGSLAPLNIASHNAESVRSAFGFKASYDWKLGGVVVKPEVRAAWQHEYGDSSYGINASFANGAGGNFLVNGPEIGRDSLLLGAGFAVQLNERAATYLYYDGELGRERYDSHSVSGGLRIAF
jgi:autotransporter-associated beta strand protein